MKFRIGDLGCKKCSNKRTGGFPQARTIKYNSLSVCAKAGNILFLVKHDDFGLMRHEKVDFSTSKNKKQPKSYMISNTVIHASNFPIFNFVID